MSVQSWVQCLTTSQIDGPPITAIGAATCLPAACRPTIPNNTFYIGCSLRIQATGRISSVITTPGTARFDIRLGGNIVFDSQAILLDTVAAHTNVGWILDIIMTCRAIGNGTAANFFGQGRWQCEDILGTPATAPKGTLAAMLPWNTAPAVGGGFDSTAANQLDMFFTQTVATGSMTVHQFKVFLEN